MTRKHLQATLLVAAASLLATGAYAEEPKPAAQHGKNEAAAAAKDAKDGAKGAAKDAKEAAKDAKEAAKDAKQDAKEAANVAGDNAKGKGTSADREVRKDAEHKAQKAKLAGMLKQPVDAAMRQELRRHAERVARLERIKTVAQEAKDTDAVERANKLLTKENDRHDKWLSRTAGATPTTTTTTTTTTKTTEGAK